MSFKADLRNYLQTRLDKLKQKKQQGEVVESGIEEIKNTAANFEIKLKL